MKLFLIASMVFGVFLTSTGLGLAAMSLIYCNSKISGILASVSVMMALMLVVCCGTNLISPASVIGAVAGWNLGILLMYLGRRRKVSSLPRPVSESWR